jgi:fermentation-respiration switch protein FrsA (DUF1100 family)
MHGSKDRLVSPSQTLMLHNALLSAGAHSTRYVLDGADHGDLAFMGDEKSGLPWSEKETMGIIVDFLTGPLGWPDSLGEISAIDGDGRAGVGCNFARYICPVDM